MSVILKKSVILFAPVLFVLGLANTASGDDVLCRREHKANGTVVGAIIGGIIGHKMGNGKAGGTIAGAVIGGAIGNDIGGKMDCDDEDSYHEYLYNCANSPYEEYPNRWNGRRSNARDVHWTYGYVNNTECRQYSNTIITPNGSMITDSGYYCRETSGWRPYRLNDPFVSGFQVGTLPSYPRQEPRRRVIVDERPYNPRVDSRTVTWVCPYGSRMIRDNYGRMFCQDGYGRVFPPAVMRQH
jgi:surface antigen